MSDTLTAEERVEVPRVRGPDVRPHDAVAPSSSAAAVAVAPSPIVTASPATSSILPPPLWPTTEPHLFDHASSPRVAGRLKERSRTAPPVTSRTAAPTAPIGHHRVTGAGLP